MPASLELVKIALQAYGNGDCEIALALADPLIRWDERASRMDGDLVWKHDEVERAMRRYLDSWEQYRFDLEDVAEVGPATVVGICRERGKPKDGAPVDRRFGGLWVVEHSKIVSWTTYLTP
jgi:ketosteroid isomerase-like protein